MKIIFGTIICILLCTNAGSLPWYIWSCSRFSFNLSGCLLNNINLLKHFLSSGIPDFGIPSLNPLRLEEFYIQSGGFKAEYTNLSVYDVDNFIITEFDFDLPNLYWNFVLKWDVLPITVNYNCNGTLIGLDFADSTGEINGNLTGITANTAVYLKVYSKTRKTRYLGVQSITLDVDIDSFDLTLTNLFKNSTENDYANKLVNQNSSSILKIIKSSLNEGAEAVAFQLYSTIFSKYSFDEMFPWY